MSRSSILAFAFELIESAQRRWNRLAGLERLAQIITGVKSFDESSEVELKNNREAKAA